MNPVVQAMNTAEREGWCVTTWCTTCGHRDFAEALVKTEAPPQVTIASLLIEVDFGELQSAVNWKDCIRSIFQRRRGPGKPPILSSAEKQWVLQRWATRLAESENLETRLTDFAMFYLVRNEPRASEALSHWVGHSVTVLRATRDRSLAETMVYFARRHENFRDGILSNVLDLVPVDGILQAALDKLTEPENN